MKSWIDKGLLIKVIRGKIIIGIIGVQDTFIIIKAPIHNNIIMVEIVIKQIIMSLKCECIYFRKFTKWESNEFHVIQIETRTKKPKTLTSCVWVVCDDAKKTSLLWISLD